jgi:hypothetical protein
MSEVIVAGFFVCSLWGLIDIVRRIKRKIRREKRPAGIMLTRAELEQIMINRAENGSGEAEEWLESHGFERRQLHES